MKALFLFILLSANIDSASAQWTTLLEPFGEDGSQRYFESIDCSDSLNCSTIGFSLTTSSQYQYDVWRSTDAGASWNRQSIPVSPRAYWPIARIKKIRALDSLNLLAVGDSGLILRTTDAGASWSQQDAKRQWSYQDGVLLDSTHGYAVANYGKILFTTDGINWSEMTSPTKFVIKLVKPNSLTRLLVFDRFYGKQFSTSDNGQSWDTLTLFKDYFGTDSGKFINDVSFWDDHRGILVGGNKHKGESGERLFVMRSDDTGHSWRVLYDELLIPAGGYAVTVDFVDSLNGVIATGSNYLAMTTDGGLSWRESLINIGKGTSSFTGAQLLPGGRILATIEAAPQAGFVVGYQPSLSTEPRENRSSALTVTGDLLDVTEDGYVVATDLVGRQITESVVLGTRQYHLKAFCSQPGIYILNYHSLRGGRQSLKLIILD